VTGGITPTREADMCTKAIERLAFAVAVVGPAMLFAPIRPAASAPAPADTEACLRTSQALYKQAEALKKRTKVDISREFVRVSANLDDYCEDKEFEKARISIEWMQTCIANFTKPYKLGFCARGKAYSCAVEPDSDGCTK
jgi:hypothetical protein